MYTESAHGRKVPLDNELKSTGFKNFLRELKLRKNKFAISYELLLARRVPKVQKLAETKVEAIMVNCELCKDQKGAILSVDQERASDCSRVQECSYRDAGARNLFQLRPGLCNRLSHK